MDKIIIKGLRFRACHGVLDQEKTDPQTFEVDLVIETDLGSAGQSDDLHDTLDYGSIYNEVKEIVMNSSFNLIEALAESIAARVLAYQLANKVTVTVKKLRPPIDGEYDYFAVEIERSR
ncbi:MAG: dihydroneopterin aldolase [Ignavibacteriales bacterium]